MHVGLLFGGVSSEHEISIRSARNLLGALQDAGHRVTPVRIARDGRWHVETPEALRGDAEPDELGHRAASSELADGLAAFLALDLDVVFPILHGQNGEDGRVQGLLSTVGLPFVGPGVLGSAVCMDKVVAKELLAAAGVPVTPYRVARRGEPFDGAEAAEALGLPLFVKPANSGSSVGVTKVEAVAGLDAALAEAYRYDPKALVEQGVAAREIECAVLGNEHPEASPLGEVVSTAAFYDYDAKYVDADASRLEVPADVPTELAGRMRAIALRAYRALACEGLARCDFFLLADGTLFVNELNTLPGFTAKSLYPAMWAEAGLDGPALADRLVRLAAERHARDAELATTR